MVICDCCVCPLAVAATTCLLCATQHRLRQRMPAAANNFDRCGNVVPAVPIGAICGCDNLLFRLQ